MNNVNQTPFSQAASSNTLGSPLIDQMMGAEFAARAQNGAAAGASGGGGCPVSAVQEQGAEASAGPEMQRLNDALGNFVQALNTTAGATG